MNNIRMLVRNLANSDVATITASPAMLSTLPETNLQQPIRRSKTARTTSTAGQRFTIDFTTAADVNMVAVGRHNWSTSATLRTRIQSAVGSPSTTSYDGGALAAWSTSGLDAYGIDVHTEADFRHLKNSVQYFALQSAAPELILDIADAANADGYIEQTRLAIGRYFEFAYDPPYEGVDLTLEDSSIAGDADDGTTIVDKGYKKRVLNIDVRFIPDTDLPTFLALTRYLGRDKDGFISVYPGVGGAKELYHMMFFRVSEDSTFNPWQVGLHKGNLVLRES
jgi:hypothetical protein